MSGTDFGWIDRGLRQLGLELDLRPDENPVPKGGPLTVDALMNHTLELVRAPDAWLRETEERRDPRGRWRAAVGRIPGNPYWVACTTMPRAPLLHREGFTRWALHDVIELAAHWDITFRGAAYTHLLLRSGEVLPADAHSVAHLPYGDIAPIMRWHFESPGLRRRELLSVYVPHADERSMTCAYLPVRGAPIPPTAGEVLARLMIPCGDHVSFGEDGTPSLVRFASAALEGWMPAMVTRSRLYRRSFLNFACVEAEHLLRLVEGTGTEGDAWQRSRVA